MGGNQSQSPSILESFLMKNLGECKRALELGADADSEYQGKRLLRIAAERGDVALFSLLHSYGASIGSCEEGSALHIAVLHSHIPLAKKLLAEFSHMRNSKNAEGRTPLHMAAGAGHQDMVSLLLKYNASPIVKDMNGFTPVDIAPHLFNEDEIQVRRPNISRRATIASIREHTNDTDQSSNFLAKVVRNTKLPLIPSDSIELGEILNRGSSCLVFRGFLQGEEVAVKQFRPEYCETKKEILKFVKEIQVLEQVRHPNILQVKGICVDPPNLCMVSELAPNGSLFQAIHKNTRSLSLSERHNIAIQITEGLVYLHGHRPPIVHRDLKPENCLLDSNMKVKIADFGLARPSTWFQDDKTTLCIGTTRFMAPELFDKEKKVGPQMDLWALGCTFIDLYSSLRPWNYIASSNSSCIYYEIFQRKPVPIPESIPEEIRKIIADCCQYDVAKRPTARQVLNRLTSIKY